MSKIITIETIVKVGIDKVWDAWTNPIHIINWNHASDDWHTTKAENDLRIGGRLFSRMEAKDGSFGFDFYGDYTNVVNNELIEFTLGDNRKVSVVFKVENESVIIEESFEIEDENTEEMQRNGWQAILNNFKKYTESL